MNVKALRKFALVVIMFLILGVLAYEVFTGSLTVSTTVVAVGALAFLAWGYWKVSHERPSTDTNG